MSSSRFAWREVGPKAPRGLISEMRVTLWAPFLLTGLSWVVQWQCGTRPRLGWLLCYGANFAWIAYAAFTDQPGFLLGGVVTALIAIRNWRRAAIEIGRQNTQALQTVADVR